MSTITAAPAAAGAWLGSAPAVALCPVRFLCPGRVAVLPHVHTPPAGLAAWQLTCYWPARLSCSQAHVPLNEMFGYSTGLRSMTQVGAGTGVQAAALCSGVKLRN